jgi:hypothetical protein
MFAVGAGVGWISYVLLSHTSAHSIGLLLDVVTFVCFGLGYSCWLYEWPQRLIPPRHRRNAASRRR